MANKKDGSYEAELVLWNANGEENTTVKVVITGGGKQMAIECERADGNGWAVLLKSKGPYFSAKNATRTSDLQVSARWVALDKTGREFVGIWIEEGNEYLFKFKLGRKTPVG
jgi:hypothetical protein